MVYTVLSFMDGEYAPAEKGFFKAFKVLYHMIKAHALTHDAIKEVIPSAQVGFNRHMRVFDPLRENNPRDAWVAKNQEKSFNLDSLEALYTGESTGFIKIPRKERELIRGKYDFMSLNYYARDSIKFDLFSPGRLFGKTVFPEGAEASHEGATGDRPEGEVYPHGIYRLLKTLSKYGKPLYVTENGIGTNDDKKRISYVVRHIAEVGKAIKDGMDVKGYYHWSTLDNFEWAEGYTMRFGMIHVDYKTLKRTVKESANVFSEIAKKNCIDAALLKKCGVTL
jgi:beta-glucosidase